MSGSPANPLKNVLLWLVTIWIIAMVVQVLATEFVFQLKRIAPWLLLAAALIAVSAPFVLWAKRRFFDL